MQDTQDVQHMMKRKKYGGLYGWTARKPARSKMDSTFPRANLSWHRHSKTRFNVEASIVGIFFAASQIIPGSFFLSFSPFSSSHARSNYREGKKLPLGPNGCLTMYVRFFPRRTIGWAAQKGGWGGRTREPGCFRVTFLHALYYYYYSYGKR